MGVMEAIEATQMICVGVIGVCVLAIVASIKIQMGG